MGYAYVAKAAATTSSTGYALNLDGDIVYQNGIPFSIQFVVWDGAPLGSQRCKVEASVEGNMRRIRADANVGYGPYCFVTLSVAGPGLGVTNGNFYVVLDPGDIGKTVTITGTMTGVTPNLTGTHVGTAA